MMDVLSFCCCVEGRALKWRRETHVLGFDGGVWV